MATLIISSVQLYALENLTLCIIINIITMGDKKMKLFATSDIHGNKKIIDKLSIIAPEVDLILICGDIGGKNFSHKSFRQFSECQKHDADYLTSFLKSTNTESRFILGNDDWFDYEDSHYLQNPERINSLLFIPFEYVLITPFNTNREANDNKLEYELNKLNADRNTIMVAHTPPLGAGDTLFNGLHCGSHSVRSWIEEIQPKIWLCGHIHENNSSNYIGNTLVLNCACDYSDNMLRGWIIDTETLEHNAVII